MEATKSQDQKEHAGDQKHTMLRLAAKVEEHYTRPSPQATRHAPNFFPQILDAGLLLGMVLGVLGGILLAWLLLGGRLAPQGWEGLFSLSPFTFYTFWALTGAAVGIATGGVLTLLMAPAPEVTTSEEASRQSE